MSTRFKQLSQTINVIICIIMVFIASFLAIIGVYREIDPNTIGSGTVLIGIAGLFLGFAGITIAIAALLMKD